MTRDDQERINKLDRDWDAYQDGHGDDPLIDRLHASDDTPNPSRHFRRNLEDSLRSGHPAQSLETASETELEPTPINQAARRSSDPDRAITRPSTLRQWGELAAIVVILSLAIAGTALYGDDAFDFAQQQIASDTDDAETVDDDTRTTLQEEGEVTGLTFEQAQELTPMQLALPEVNLEGLSDPEFSVFASANQTRKPGLVWPHWRAEAVYESNDALPSIEISFAPAWSPGSHGTPLPSNVGRHQDAPSGTFDVVSIGESHALRGIELTDERNAISHFQWHQGHVAVTLSAPVWTDLDEEQSDWIDMPETPFTYEDIEALIASMLENGKLDDGAEHIATRGLLMGDVLELTPTAPFPDSVPEPLELQRADAHPNGPTLFMSHPDDSVHGVWLHSFVGLGTTMPGGSVQADLRETLSPEEFEAGGVPVTRLVFDDPKDPDLAEFLLTTRNTDLLLPWISGADNSSLVVYLWQIAGMSFVMGIEVNPDAVERSESGEITLTDELVEEHWLELIREQRLVADETLDPEALFPELAREATEEEEQLLAEPDGRTPMMDQIESIRLLGEQDDIRFYIGMTSNQGICAITTVEDDGDESIGASGCNAIWHAADVGSGIYSSGAGQPAILAYVLPEGYDEVVDADGEVIGEVENQLFAMVFESGDSRPSDMIARGPAGELYLDLGTSGRSQRGEQPTIETP